MADALELQLRALEIEWPATPDLAAAVEARLAAPDPARRRRRRWLGGFLGVLLVTGVAVSPASSALLDLLGLRGAKVERAEPPPHPTVQPGRFGEGLRLGTVTTLDAARRQAGFPLTVPASLGTPDAVWVDTQPVRVSFVYRRRPGIPPAKETNAAALVTQLRAGTTPVLEKAVGAGARLSSLRVPHARVYLITGEPHGFAWMAPDGSVGYEERRLAGTTLLVERDDGILLRAEARLTGARARALARELAGG